MWPWSHLLAVLEGTPWRDVRSRAGLLALLPFGVPFSTRVVRFLCVLLLSACRVRGRVVWWLLNPEEGWYGCEPTGPATLPCNLAGN